MGEKVLCVMVGIALIAFAISLIESPPGTAPNCYSPEDLDKIRADVAILEKTLR